MKRLVLAALALCFAVPTLAHAGNPPGVKAQIAAQIRQQDPGLKFHANSIKPLALNAPKGSFMLNKAYKPGPAGLAPTLYKVSGSWDDTSGKMVVTNFKATPDQIQPR